MRALGAHVYAGGHTVGVLQAGFAVTHHLEEGNFGAETSRRNLGVEVRVGVENWHPGDFGPGGREGHVDWVYTNPPCAAWSAGGYKVRKCTCIAGEEGAPFPDAHLLDCALMREGPPPPDARWRTDARVDCCRRCFDLVDPVQPLVFSWECVARAAQAADFQRDRVRFCWERGYDVHALLFDGADAGLASRRRRFFFVASRVALEFEAPSVGARTPRQVWEGLDPGPVVPLGKNEQRVIEAMPPGRGQLSKSFTSLIAKVENGYRPGQKMAGRPSFMHRRLAWDEPSFTVAGGQHLYHPEEPRSLTVAEQAALLGYPRGYEFVGRPTAQYAQIGKAVTPPAAKWLADNVMRGLVRGEPTDPLRRRSTMWDFLKGAGRTEWYQP